MIDGFPKCIGRQATLYFVDSSSGTPCKILDIQQGWILVRKIAKTPEETSKTLLLPSTIIDSIIFEGEEDEG